MEGRVSARPALYNVIAKDQEGKRVGWRRPLRATANDTNHPRPVPTIKLVSTVAIPSYDGDVMMPAKG